MKPARLCLIVGLGTSLAACGMFPKAEVKPAVVIDTACYAFSPIRLTRAEILALSDESLKQILAHNEKWSRSCDQKRQGAP